MCFDDSSAQTARCDARVRFSAVVFGHHVPSTSRIFALYLLFLHAPCGMCVLKYHDKYQQRRFGMHLVLRGIWK